MKVAFFGTPDFALPALAGILDSSRHQLVCIVTQPDKPVGRGGQVVFSAVKKFAIQHGIPFYQPDRINKELQVLDKYKPDIIVTCAFGQILNQAVLDYAPHGVINIHASLLPKYRGSSPIQWAIIKGEKTTGITIMQTDIGLDTGDIITQSSLDIVSGETAGELFARLAELGGNAIVGALDLIKGGKMTRMPQDHADATAYPKLSKEGARINWNKSALEIKNFIHGLNPWPVAFFMMNDEAIRVFRASVVSFDSGAKAGEVVCADTKRGLIVATSDGFLQIDVLQAPNSRQMSARDFLNGRKISVGTVLG
jgi:methionyl-tRNA formyltransferase